MTGPANLLTEWARLLAATLQQAGVEDVVVSPGSRSTAFVWAALRRDGLRCRSIIDERDAAFFAVGHARITGRPVALLCTSGSAPANYLPAVVEASRSGIPLLVLSADRPFELQAADAPQTIDQARLYGVFARGYFDPGMPDPHPKALRALQRTAAQAVHRTRWPTPGPVQVNLRARKPLEPVEATDDRAAELRQRVDGLIAGGATQPAALRVGPAAGALEEMASGCAGAGRGVIVCGPVPPCHAPDPSLVLELARRTGFPLLPEATSQLRFRVPTDGDVVVCDAFDALLRAPSFRARFAPRVVLQLGSPPTSTGWRDLGLVLEDVERHVFSLQEWSDPRGDARSVVQGPLDAGIRALLEVLDAQGMPAGTDHGWREWVRHANTGAWKAVEAALDGEEATGLLEADAVRATVGALPGEAVLALGNSLPVREVDTFCPAGERGLTVWSQRGASGIDGLVAGAAGAATAAGRPTALLLGDVSLLHDVGGLASARDVHTPFAIVVLDNGGGRIFEQLPFAATDTDLALVRFWTTPPGIRFDAAATTFGIRHRQADTSASVGAAVGEALGTPGPTLIHVPIAGDRTVPLHRAVWSHVEEAFAGAAGPATDGSP